MGFFSSTGPKRTAPRRPAPKAQRTAFDAEADKAMAELELKTAAHIALFHMDTAEWSVDQETGLIEFTDHARGMVAQAPVQIIGSFNTRNSTWLWGWANPEIAAPLQADAKRMQAHGGEKGYAQLSTATIRCGQKAAWKLAALSCMVCGRQGVYRGPADETMVFMAFGTVSMRKMPQ